MLAAECKHCAAPSIMHNCAYPLRRAYCAHTKFKPLICLGGASTTRLPAMFLAQNYPDTVLGLSANELRMLLVCNAVWT